MIGGPIDHMSTPFYTLIVQELPQYNHEFADGGADDWYMDPCVISTRVDDGGTVLRKDASDDNFIEVYTNVQTDENTITTAQVVAYYSTYNQPLELTVLASSEHSQSITVAIDERCIIT